MIRRCLLFLNQQVLQFKKNSLNSHFYQFRLTYLKLKHRKAQGEFKLQRKKTLIK